MYYDSAVINWDTKHNRYKEITRRHKILTEFAAQVEIIDRQDSLLALAKMDSVALNKYIDKAIERDIAAAKKKVEDEKRSKEIAEAKASAIPLTGIATDPNANPSWYFANPVTVSNGYTDFLRTWGKRKLEDHWRRSIKDVIVEFKDDSTLLAENQNGALENKGADLAPKVDRNAYLKNVPFTNEAQVKANEEIKDALYNLGKIYNFKLYIKDSAVVTFRKQIKRYPGNDHEPEILYLLYLIAQDKKDAKLKAYAENELRTKYPYSTYTKLIDNPNYLVENKTNSKAAGLVYKDAYRLYNQKDTLSTDSLITLYHATYKDGTSIDDKFAMLKILNQLNKKEDRESIPDSLDQFIVYYPSSSLVEYATNVRDLLTGKKTTEKAPLEQEPPVEIPTIKEPEKEIPNNGLLIAPSDEK